MTVAAGENVLVVVLDQHPDPDAVRAAVAGPDRIRVRFVAPAHVGPLHWATTDEDEDRAQAEAQARAESATLTGAQCPGAACPIRGCATARRCSRSAATPSRRSG